MKRRNVLYNGARRRWELPCGTCGQMIWTRKSRIRIYGNLARHYRNKHSLATLAGRVGRALDPGVCTVCETEPCECVQEQDHAPFPRSRN